MGWVLVGHVFPVLLCSGQAEGRGGGGGGPSSLPESRLRSRGTYHCREGLYHYAAVRFLMSVIIRPFAFESTSDKGLQDLTLRLRSSLARNGAALRPPESMCLSGPY